MVRFSKLFLSKLPQFLSSGMQEESIVPEEQLMIGDMVEIMSGDQIPIDIR